MILLIEYYETENLRRYGEYITCLLKNIPYFNKIFVFSNDNLPFKDEKITIIKHDRPTFKDFFDFCNHNLKDEICVIANGDIIFDSSIEFLEKTNLENKFIAISRWEKLKPPDKDYYQDVWAFKSPIMSNEEMKFNLGIPGCDNRISRIMFELGYTIRNPGLQIKTFHFHFSNHRPLLQLEIKIPGPYMVLTPNDDIEKETIYSLKDEL